MPPEADIIYCGFSDQRNIGDWALYSANRHLFPRFNLVPEGSAASLDINLFGGGTHYPYALTEGHYRRRRLNFAIGLGVHDPGDARSFGFLTRMAMRRWRFARLGVRGYRSQAICARHGIETVVTGDTALYFSRASAAPSTPGLVAVSIVGELWGQRRPDTFDAVFAGTLECCRRLRASGARLLLVPFCRNDIPAMERLRDSLPEADFLNFWEPPVSHDLERFLGELGTCEVMIGERLHAVVLAAGLNIPFLSLGYKPKCLDFAGSIGFERFLVPSEQATGAELARLAEEILKARDDVRAELEQRVTGLRCRIHDMAAAITDDIDEFLQGREALG